MMEGVENYLLNSKPWKNYLISCSFEIIDEFSLCPDIFNKQYFVILNGLISRWTWISIIDTSKGRLKELDNDEILTSLVLLNIWFIGCILLCNYPSKSKMDDTGRNRKNLEVL